MLIKNRAYHLTTLVVFLLACGTVSSVPTPAALPPVVVVTVASSSTPIPPTETPTPTVTPTPLPQSNRVLIVSFDGLRPDAISEAKMVNVMSLMESGAYSLTAQTIMPSTTLPSHASMLVGTCPAKHIVRWNEYVPQNGYAMGTDIFDLVHAAGMRTIMVVGKEKLRQITEPASTDYFEFVDDTDKIDDPYRIEQLVIRQLDQGFSLMFVHFPNGDLAGHEYGWMSRRQLETYNNDDESLGFILQSLKGRDMFDSTLIIITSDHGGHDTTHGYDVPEDRTIPWVVSGPGIVHTQLTSQIHTMDTAATAAFALRLSIPPEWDGLPIYEAYSLPPGNSGGC